MENLKKLILRKIYLDENERKRAESKNAFAGA